MTKPMLQQGNGVTGSAGAWGICPGFFAGPTGVRTNVCMPFRPQPCALRAFMGGLRAFAPSVIGSWLVAAGCGELRAALISVPNASFESPRTTYASPNIDAWQKSPKPDWYVESGGFLWSQLTGAFTNIAPTGGVAIDNCDGTQATWLFAVPEVGLFQDYFSMDWNDPEPTHGFDATFEVGKSYTLTVGVIVGIPPMAEGVSLEISLYAVATGSNRTTVAAVSITNSPSVFSNVAHFMDFQVLVPTVKESDPWAGQHIGIQMLSTVSTNLQGGYWDLDNVRLMAVAAPILENASLTNGQFQFTVRSEPGGRLEVQAATNGLSPGTAWNVVGTLTNASGTTLFTDPQADFDRRFYRAVQLP